MAKEIDGVKYRTSVLKIVTNKKDTFCKAYCAFASAKGQKLGMDFLKDTGKVDPKSQFEIYFSPKPKKKISAIPSSVRQKADTLATLGEWKDKDWKKIYEDAREAVAKDIEKTITDKFFKSEVFEAVHKRYAKKKGEKIAAKRKEMEEMAAKREEMAAKRKGVRFAGSPIKKLANTPPRHGVRLTKGR